MIYRYRLRGPSAKELAKYVGSAGVVGTTAVFVDIDLPDQTRKADLDEYMNMVGYDFDSEDPQTPL